MRSRATSRHPRRAARSSPSSRHRRSGSSGTSRAGSATAGRADVGTRSPRATAVARRRAPCPMLICERRPSRRSPRSPGASACTGPCVPDECGDDADHRRAPSSRSRRGARRRTAGGKTRAGSITSPALVSAASTFHDRSAPHGRGRMTLIWLGRCWPPSDSLAPPRAGRSAVALRGQWTRSRRRCWRAWRSSAVSNCDWR